jgi:hypothetical protein
MSQTLDQHQLAKRLLELKQLATPIETEIETLTEQLRSLVAAKGNTKIEATIPGWGKVTASAASERTLKGTAPALDLEAWTALQPRLRKMGVVKDEAIYSQARKSSVSIKLDATVAAAALLAAA